jgi:15-cis-phytoene synthase
MTVASCADLVRQGDPDRFLATMAAPPVQRGPLFVLYACNIEVARAPWASDQPMIAEMRLQWWRDVVANAASGAARAHEVAGPLHALIAEGRVDVTVLDRLIAARRHDCWPDPFADQAALDGYLEDTGGGLMWLATQALGAGPKAETVARAVGWANGLANYLRAVPDLMSRGRQPLVDATPKGISDLAKRGLQRLAEARRHRASVGPAAPALLAAWQAGPILHQAAREPSAVLQGRLATSEFRRRAGLLWQTSTGRW